MPTPDRTPDRDDAEDFSLRPVAPDASDDALPTPRELEDELTEIYSSDDRGIHRDMSRLERARGTTMRKFLVGMIVFFGALAAVAWAGFFFFSPTNDKFTGEDVTVSIDGPGEVKSGEETTYVVKYENGEGVALGTSALEVRLPKAFVVTSTEPATENNDWHIGSIGPGKSGEVHITGVFLAGTGSELDVQAILTYRPADFNSEFQRVATRTLLVGDSVMTTSVSGPDKVLPGDEVAIEFTYENTSPNDFSDLVLRAEYPEGFIPTSSDPESEDGDFHEWRIDKVPAGEKGTVTVHGNFASDAQGELVFGSTLGFLDDAETFQKQAENTFTTEVLQGELVTTLIMNGKTSDQPVRFGDTLRYAVTFRNTGESSLGNITLSVQIDSEPETGLILWNQLEDENGGVRDGNTITWTSKQLRQLERLDANDEGVIEFLVPVSAEVPEGAEGDIQIKSHVTAKIESIDGDVVERETQSQPMVAHLLSDTALAGAARYFAEDSSPLGKGPLPPKVGQATTYRIVWHLTNALHDLSDLRLSTKLPQNVRYTGNSSVDAGDLSFDAGEDKMIWTLNWLPTDVSDLNVAFDVEITPTEEQSGKIPTLVDASIFEATDNVAQSTMLLSLPPMSTAAEEDPLAAGLGRVEAAN